MPRTGRSLTSGIVMVWFDKWRAIISNPRASRTPRGLVSAVINRQASDNQAVTIDPGPGPIEAGQPCLFLGIERPEHTRPFHEFAAARDGAAGRISIALNDGVTPDRIALIDFGFH